MIRISRVPSLDAELLAQLTEIYARAYRDEPLYAEQGLKRIRRYLKWLFRHARGAFWVARAGRDPVGFLALEEMEPVPEIHEIAVDPEWQGKNVARKLMQEALNYLKEKGYARVGLWVGEHNLRAQRFYQRLGFVPGERVGIWLRMEKDLQPDRASSSNTRKAVSTSEREILSSGV